MSAKSIDVAATAENNTSGRESTTDESHEDLTQRQGHAEIEVDPDMVLSDPDIKALRDWNGTTEQELSLPSLARLIEEEGQTTACITYAGPDGAIYMVDGERRRAAVKMLREQGKLDQDGEEFLLRIVVLEMSPEQAFRAAMMSFTQKEAMTPVEFGRSLEYIRRKFGWEGANHTVEVADFLGVSPATVSQAEKMVAMPTPIVDDIQAGKLKKTAALELTTTPRDKQQLVYEVAKRKAKNDAEKKQEKTAKAANKSAKNNGKGKKADKQTAAAETDTETPVVTAAVTEDAPVEYKHIRAAQKEVEGALSKPKAPKMAESIELIETWDGPAYPDVMRKFAAAYVDWGRGKLKSGDKGLEAAWDDVADALAGKTATKSVAKPTAWTSKPTVTKPTSKTNKPTATKSTTKPATKPAVKKKK